MAFIVPDTSTDRIDFREYLSKNEADAWPLEAVNELNLARQRMCDALGAQPSSQALLDTITAYLPHLLRLLKFYEMNRNRDVIKFKWRSVLSAGIRTSLSGTFEKPAVKCQSIYYEAIYVLLTYGFTLYSMAARKLSPAIASATESDCNEAVELYCRAAGVFSHVAVSIAPRWNNPPKDRPPETSTDSVHMMVELALADAQLVAAHKAERRGMSSNLLMKLYSFAVQKYATCAQLLRRSKRDFEEFSVPFKSYIDGHASYYDAMNLKRLAIASAEEAKNGTAVACITHAYNLLVDCEKSEYPSIKRLAAEQIAIVRELHSSYVMVNNNVTYQRVPDLVEARAPLAASRSVVEIKMFDLPPALPDLPEPAKPAPKTAASATKESTAEASKGQQPAPAPLEDIKEIAVETVNVAEATAASATATSSENDSAQ